MKQIQLFRKMLLAAAVSIIALMSCQKAENSRFTDTPIVESYLLPGDTFAVQLSHQTPFYESVTYASDDINNLHVYIHKGNESFQLEPAGNGKYIHEQLLIAEGDTFNLSFRFNEKEVSGRTWVPAKPVSMSQSVTRIYLPKIDSTSGFPGQGLMPEPVEISWSNPDNSYYLIIIENIETDPELIRELDEDEDRPAFAFRKAPTSNNSEMLRPMEFEYFGTHRIILFHVLPDYAALYEQNSSSSLNLTNPSTSISNAYGIFTGLSSDTLMLEVKKE